MDALEQINQHLTGQPTQPPIEQWNPELSGDIDIVIQRDGQWLHEGGVIERHSLVKLFFSILRREHDGEYYLVTPIEKWRIQVEQAAAVVTDMEVFYRGSERQQIVFTTDVDQMVLLSRKYPLVVESASDTGEPLPLLQLPHGLKAKLSRAVFYRLIDCAEQQGKQCRVMSEGCWFVLGKTQ